MVPNLSKQKTVSDENTELLELYRKLLLYYESMLRSKRYMYTKHSLGLCHVLYDMLNDGTLTFSESVKLREDLRHFKCRDEKESPYWFYNSIQRISVLNNRIDQLIRNECTQSFKNRLNFNLGAKRLNLSRYDNKA